MDHDVVQKWTVGPTGHTGIPKPQLAAKNRSKIDSNQFNRDRHSLIFAEMDRVVRLILHFVFTK